LTFVLFIIGCNKNAIQPNATLQFSSDSVFIDTVITQLGTSTQELIVYNPHKKTVVISSIKMANGSNSEFIFNVNGMGTGEQKDIEIRPNDSIYIFIQAKLKKNNVDTVVTHEDKLIFTLNDKVQDVKIVSWGRDASFIKNQTIQTTTWTASKSFLIFDSLTVDVGQTLTIEEGVMVLFKPRANLIIKGTLVVKGTIEKPVIFEGYRLESRYQNIPGQWGSIILSSSSSNNTIKNAVITDGTSGFVFESSSKQVDLDLENVIINQMSYSGLTCYGSKIRAINCVFANCCSYILELKEGGDYQFTHTTISNNSRNNCNSSANKPSIYIDNYKLDGTVKSPKDLVNASFKNCIIYGNYEDFSEFNSIPNALYNMTFVNSLLYESKRNSYMDPTSGLIKPSDKVFSKHEKGFALDSASVARNFGDLSIGTLYPFDIKGRSRIVDGKPDIGAYEYFKDTTKAK